MVYAGWLVPLMLLRVLHSVVNVTTYYWFLSLVTKAVVTEHYGCAGLSADTQPDPGLIFSIDPFRIHVCMNQGLAGIQPPLAQGK